MSLLQRVRNTLGILGLVILGTSTSLAGAGFVPQNTEFHPLGILPGDQVHPSAAISASGGWVVYQDNITDGDGLGISAQRLDGTFSQVLSPFRINQQGGDDQENPQITMLKNGGAAFVWQGGKQSFQHIYARFLSSSNTFITGDVQVNSASNYQINPVVTTLGNGNVVFAWSSFGQESGASPMQGVFARVFTPAGQPVTGEFQVNQFTPFNQRTPAIASLNGGNFVAVWISEQQSFTNSVQVYARIFGANGAPVSNEFLVNSGTNFCANPTVAGAVDGTFLVSWAQRDGVVRNNGWDVYARSFSAVGTPGTIRKVNSQLFGDQFSPSVSVVGGEYLVAWTSKGQDGSGNGIFGQLLYGDATHDGDEFGVNTVVAGDQIHPFVASDASGRFLAVWASFNTPVNGTSSMDIASRQIISVQQSLAAPGTPLVFPISSGQLQVTWPSIAGFTVSSYLVYVDGSNNPLASTGNYLDISGLNPGSTHSVRLAYLLDDGRLSPLSSAATATTWGLDANGDGLPDNWETLYYGSDSSKWPNATNRLSADGITVGMVFQMGGNPLQPATWLRTSVTHTSQGAFLTWPTQVGSVYQLVGSATANGIYTNVGTPRLAAGTSDSVFLGFTNRAGYFRLMRVR